MSKINYNKSLPTIYCIISLLCCDVNSCRRDMFQGERSSIFALMTHSIILIGFIELLPSCYDAFQSSQVEAIFNPPLSTLANKSSSAIPSRLYLSHPAPLHIGHIGVGQREKCVKSQSWCWSKFWHSEGQRGKWREGKVNCKVGEGKSTLLTPTFKHIVAPHSSTSSPAFKHIVVDPTPAKHIVAQSSKF